MGRKKGPEKIALSTSLPLSIAEPLRKVRKLKHGYNMSTATEAAVSLYVEELEGQEHKLQTPAGQIIKLAGAPFPDRGEGQQVSGAPPASQRRKAKGYINAKLYVAEDVALRFQNACFWLDLYPSHTVEHALRQWFQKEIPAVKV